MSERRSYQGPRGLLQRQLLEWVRPGCVYRLPPYTTDKQVRSAIARMIKKGSLELVPGRSHLFRLRR